MNDDELIAARPAGDETALRELFTGHVPWLTARGADHPAGDAPLARGYSAVLSEARS